MNFGKNAHSRADAARGTSPTGRRWWGPSRRRSSHEESPARESPATVGSYKSAGRLGASWTRSARRAGDANPWTWARGRRVIAAARRCCASARRGRGAPLGHARGHGGHARDARTSAPTSGALRGAGDLVGHGPQLEGGLGGVSSARKPWLAACERGAVFGTPHGGPAERAHCAALLGLEANESPALRWCRYSTVACSGHDRIVPRQSPLPRGIPLCRCRICSSESAEMDCRRIAATRSIGTREGDRCVALLRELIRIPTVNPPGNERPAAELLAGKLRDARGRAAGPRIGPDAHQRRGAASLGPGRRRRFSSPRTSTSSKPTRQVDAAALRGRPGRWCIWGRGAIDMKNMVAMSACVMRLLARHNAEARARRDLRGGGRRGDRASTWAAVPRRGARRPGARRVRARRSGRLLAPHDGTRLLSDAGRRKRASVGARARFRRAGHGSMPRGTARSSKRPRQSCGVGKTRLADPSDRGRDATFCASSRRALPHPARLVLPQLSSPALAGCCSIACFADRRDAAHVRHLAVEHGEPDGRARGLEDQRHPGRPEFEIDGRTLPGQREQEFMREMRARRRRQRDARGAGQPAAGRDRRSTRRCSAVSPTRSASTIPSGMPHAAMIPGFTDAKAYSRLGTKYYGFSPVRFAPNDGISFAALYHGKDERIPEAGLRWGLRTLYDAVIRFCDGLAVADHLYRPFATEKQTATNSRRLGCPLTS